MRTVLVLALLAGAAGAETGPTGVAFTDVTQAAGIRFKHTNGAFGKKYLPETIGAGGAFLDYDGDGWIDIFLANSRNWKPRAGQPVHPALYRNNHDGTFTDVTKAAGLAVESYGIGAAAADVDNDGRPDLYLFGVGGNRLFRNLGGRFVDVTARSGIAAGGFSTAALFFDYDKDGRLDLLVGRYVEWSLEKDLFCTLDGTHKSYCTPESYRGQTALLFHNDGAGAFSDVTQRAGLLNAASKALGLAMLDYDGDGWPDVFVANDTQPNKLYRNNGNGTFTDVAVSAGVAFSEAGAARAGMGVDAADYDGSGRPGLVVGNFSNEMMALYHNEGTGLFVDDAPTTVIGRSSLLTLAFGCFFFDYDLDGLPDLLAANGHVADDIAAVQAQVKYAQAPHVFRNLGGRKFEDMGARLGPALQRPLVGRGAAYADIDNDGDLDVLLTTNNGAPTLLRNDGGNRNGWLRVRTVGGPSNRDGVGARVTVTRSGGTSSWALVHTGSSFASQSELAPTFGLGPAPGPVRVEVAWPSGRVDSATGVPPNRTVTMQEGKGLVPLPESR